MNIMDEFHLLMVFNVHIRHSYLFYFVCYVEIS
jgi:hypothetical protein